MKKGDKFCLIYQSIKCSDVKLSISSLCKAAGVSRSGYYRWLSSAKKKGGKEVQDRADFELILEAYNHRGYDKGCRGIYMRLLRKDIVMNIKKIRRLMRKYGLYCKIRKANPFRLSLRESEGNHIAPNIVKREFLQHGPRKVLLTDVTYIRLKEGFCYLSTIIDAYTRQILSYVVSESFNLQLLKTTIDKMMQEHGNTISSEAVVHSDQGVQYKLTKYAEVLSSYKLRQSMSRKGNCWDNAPQESFYGHMKDCINDRVKKCNTLEEIQIIVDEWMDFYNNERYQWNLGCMSPNEYYEYITAGKCSKE